MFTPKPTQLVVFGIDKQRVSQVLAQLRSIRIPEPYKGKGLRRKTDIILRKEIKKKVILWFFSCNKNRRPNIKVRTALTQIYGIGTYLQQIKSVIN